MIRFHRHITSAFATIALAAMMAGCAQEDLDAPQPDYGDGDAQLVIDLAVPQSIATQSRSASTEADPSAAECGINDLRIIAFSTDGGTPCINRSLIAPSKMQVSPNGTVTYQIDNLAKGSYRIYIVANLDELTRGITTEADLKKVLINTDASHPLQAGNLPMVYDPGNGSVSIPEAGKGSDVRLTLSMKFACVKVRYNLVFDKKFNSDIFGNNGMVINSVTADNVPNAAYLVTNTATNPATRNGVKIQGAHYPAYSENQANASARNADVITVSGTAAARPSDTSHWVYQGTIYLPERYDTSKPITFNIGATVTDSKGADGNVTCRYTLPLGDTDTKLFPRGAYYEIIAKITTLGDAELKASIIKKDWEEQTLSADMIHTTLSLSKTTARVTSLEQDSIVYSTDGATAPTFECATLLPASGTNRNQAVIPAYNHKTHTISFRVNPAVDIVSLPQNERKGTAECYIVAGNIRKQVKVDYDITPFFNIRPLALKLQWVDGQKIETYAYSTNLGGIDIASQGTVTTAAGSGTMRIGGSANRTSYEDTKANSRISLTCSDPSAPEGTITVTLVSDPLVTTVHYFDAAPRKGASDSPYTRYELRQDLQVTTMTGNPDYRIYFRAINDYVHDEGNGWQTLNSTFLRGDWSRFPKEDYNSYSDNSVQSPNWNDWWHSDDYKGIYNDDHNIYIYTQIGETTSAGSHPASWHFTGDYNSPTDMTGDNVNPGWYYYDLPADRESDYVNGTRRKPEPGKTLMIFYAAKANGYGFEAHRASHHEDPGIPLFDYEDHEGYVIYDPTSEPYYRIYDEKPYIEDVTYTIYSTEKITEWWQKYGVAENKVTFDNPKQWIMKGTFLSQTTEVINGKTYQVAQLKFKAPRGDYEKAIKLSGLTPGSSTPSTAQYVYYCANGNNPYNPPCIYLFFGDNDRLTDWKSAPAMERCGTLYDKPLYRYQIPPHFATAKVILKRQGDVSGDANQTVECSLEGRSMINYGDNRTYWTTYGTQPTQGSSDGVVLFGGRSFASQGHIGTYENGKWTAGRPK